MQIEFATICVMQIVFIVILTSSYAEITFSDTYLEESVEALENDYAVFMENDLFWSEWDASILHERNVKQGLSLLASGELLDTDENYRRALIFSLLSAPSRFVALETLLECYKTRKISKTRVQKYFDDEERWFFAYKLTLREAQEKRSEVHKAFVEEIVKLALYVASI